MSLTPEREAAIRHLVATEAYEAWDIGVLLAALDEARDERDGLQVAYGLRCKLAHEREDELAAERDRLAAALDEARAERDAARKSLSHTLIDPTPAPLSVLNGLRATEGLPPLEDHPGWRIIDEWEAAIAERDRLAAACAAMRAVLEEVAKGWPVWFGVQEALAHALSNDAGRGWVSPQAAEQIAKALRHVIADSPGTPHSVKKYLAALEAEREGKA